MEENKMGVMPVNKLLLNMAVPMIISMIVQALYNVVDSIFVSKISEDALTALSMAFPIQNLMIAVGIGISVGMNALLSRSLGEKRQEHADKIATQGLVLNVVGSIIFVLFGLFFTRRFMLTQTSDEAIVNYGTHYLSICTIFSFGFFLQVIFERMLQSTGRTFLTMITQSLGAIINIILDPILIFGLFGFPKLEEYGAAIATVTGQIIAAILAFAFNVKKNPDVNLKLKNCIPDFEIIKQILYIGIPSILMAAIGSVMTFSMNKILFTFSSTAVAVFGVYFKLQSFVFMPVFGLNNGMVPIVAFNYGAAKPDRMKQTIKFSMIYAVAYMMLGFTVFQLFPDKLVGIFSASGEMLKIGIAALRSISYSYFFAGICIISLSVCQALGDSIYSLIVSAARQLLVLIPTAFLLSKIGVLEYVWFAFPIAELVSVVLSVVFIRRTWKKAKVIMESRA